MLTRQRPGRQHHLGRADHHRLLHIGPRRHRERRHIGGRSLERNLSLQIRLLEGRIGRDGHLKVLAHGVGLQFRRELLVAALRGRKRNGLLHVVDDMDPGGDVALGVGGNGHDRKLRLDVNGFPDRAFELQPDRGLGFVIAGHRHGLEHLAAVIGAVKLDGDGAGFARFDLAAPVTGGGAAARGLDIGQDKQFIAGIGKDKGVFDRVAGFDFAKIIDRGLELNLGSDGADSNRSGRRGRSGSRGLLSEENFGPRNQEPTDESRFYGHHFHN